VPLADFKRIKTEDIDADKNARNILMLQNGNPFFSIDHITVRKSGHTLFVGIPEEFREQLLSEDKNAFNFISRENLSFNGQDNFDDLEEMTCISDFGKKIKMHSYKVAQRLLQLKNKGFMRHNGEMFGVKTLSSSRDHQDESPRISTSLYTTDYFTYRVFASIYSELASQIHAISRVTTIQDLINSQVDYSPFLSSFGVSTYVICENDTQIILSERSALTTHLDEDADLHYSMNEAFTYTDCEGDIPNLRRCIFRGLREELGISNVLSENAIPQFMSLLMVKNRFELGLNSIIKLPRMKFSQICESFEKRSVDGNFENTSLKALPFEEQAIEKFLKNSKMTEGARFGLQSLYIRLAAGEV
jgi:hypothetical protein